MTKHKRLAIAKEARVWATARCNDLTAASTVFDSIPKSTLFDLLRRAYSTGYAKAERDMENKRNEQ